MQGCLEDTGRILQVNPSPALEVESGSWKRRRLVLSFTCWELSSRRVENPILPPGPRPPGPPRPGPPQGFGCSANASLRSEALRAEMIPITPTAATATAVFRGNGRDPAIVVKVESKKGKLGRCDYLALGHLIWGGLLLALLDGAFYATHTVA